MKLGWTFAPLFLAHLAFSQTPVFVLNPTGNLSRINRMVVTADRSTIITFGDDKSICFWNASSGSLLKIRWLDIDLGEGGRIIDVDLGLKTDLLAIARINSSGQPVVTLLDIHSDKILGSFQGFSQELGFVRIDPSEKFILTGSAQGGNKYSEAVRLWKIPAATGKSFVIDKSSAKSIGISTHDLCFYDEGGKIFFTPYYGESVTLEVKQDPAAIPEYRIDQVKDLYQGIDHVEFMSKKNRIFCAEHNGRLSTLDKAGSREIIFERTKSFADSSLIDCFISPSNEFGMTTGSVMAGGEQRDFYEIFNLTTKKRINTGGEWFQFVQFLSDSTFVAAAERGLVRFNFLTRKEQVLAPIKAIRKIDPIQYGPEFKIAFDSLRQVFDFQNLTRLSRPVSWEGFSGKKLSFENRKLAHKAYGLQVGEETISVFPVEDVIHDFSYINNGHVVVSMLGYRSNRNNLLGFDITSRVDKGVTEPEVVFEGSLGAVIGIAPTPDLTSTDFVTRDRFGVLSLWSGKSDVIYKFKNHLRYWPFQNLNLEVRKKDPNPYILPKDKYKGNLKKNDHLLSINDFYPKNKEGIIQYLESLDPMIPVKLKVQRGTEEVVSELMLDKIKVSRPLISLITLENDEWLCWTPQGYYAASAGGEKFGGWVINKGINEFAEFHPMYDFKKQFHRPELVSLVVSTGYFKKAVGLYNEKAEQPVAIAASFNEKLPPSIAWMNPVSSDTILSTHTIHLKAQVNSSTALQGAKILLNGRTVLRRDQISIKQERGLPRYEVSFDIDLPSLENIVNLYVENENGSTISDERVLRLKQIETGVEKYKPNLYLLSVGISKNQTPAYALLYADKDATSISSMYESQKEMLFKNVFSRTLVNEQATRANILDSFYWLEKNATQKDVVVIFVASHGINEKDKFYILPYDGDPERIRVTGVDWLNFSDVLGNLPSKVLLFVDACHSGKLGTNISAKRGDVDLMEAIRELATEENGVVIMAASTGRESSLESGDWQHGAFTFALLEGLKDGKADINRDGIINIREIDYYVAERVKELTNGLQHPTTQKPSVVSEFPLVQLH